MMAGKRCCVGSGPECPRTNMFRQCAPTAPPCRTPNLKKRQKVTRSMPGCKRSGTIPRAMEEREKKTDLQKERDTTDLQFPDRRMPAGPTYTGDYRPGDVVGGKYEVVDIMGRGSNGVTYKALGPDGRAVAVKALSLRSMTGGWKQLELFEREAHVLEGLKHPGIPQYVDYLTEDTEKDRGFFLVQELAEGKSLAQLMAEGWRADEGEVTRIALELLGILQYLGSRRPAVVHRDVKAENVVLEGGRAGGRVFLVDFGGVQAASAADSAGQGSTMIGTYGYMAPEQFGGAALPASDLYGLGGTLLFLLSGKPPSAFRQDRLRLDFRGSVTVGERLDAVLDGLLEPLVEDRMSGEDAAAILRGETSPAALSRSGGDPPGARATVSARGDTLEIDIPRGRLFDADRASSASFAVVWNGAIAAWTVSALAAGSLFGAAFSLPFWVAGYQVAKDAFGGAFTSENLSIGRQRWRLKRGAREGAEEGRTADLRGADVQVVGYVNGEPRTQLVVLQGFQKIPFGTGVSLEEQQWLAGRINTFLERTTGRTPPPVAAPKPLRSGMPERGVSGGAVWNARRSSLDWDSLDDD